MEVQPILFEERAIRRVYDEKTETWFFSVVDIIQVLDIPALAPARATDGEFEIQRCSSS